MTREHLVVLRILNDDDTRPWWDAMGLLDPARWSSDEAFGPTVYVSIEAEAEVKRP